MMYYGTDTYKIAHFPFNFNLIFTTHSLSPKTMDILIKSWTERVPEHGVANWQVEYLLTKILQIITFFDVLTSLFSFLTWM